MNLFDSTRDLTSQSLGFVTTTLDRAAWRRDDASWQQTAMADPSSRHILICKDTPVLAFQAERLEACFSPARAADLAPSGQSVFLGMDNGVAFFGRHLDTSHFDALKLRTDLKLIDMRSIAMQGLFTPGLINAIGTAKAMLLWHQRHGFCSQCGQPTVAASAGWKRICQACSSEHFPRTDPVVIMLAIDGERCLMGRSPQFPEGRYSCLAGFMEPGETIEDAVRREIFEETGITTGQVRYAQGQPWPFPGSLMIGCLAEATSTEITIDATELADARWFTREEVRLILRGEHPRAISSPPPMAIAHHLMRLFAEG